MVQNADPFKVGDVVIVCYEDHVIRDWRRVVVVEIYKVRGVIVRSIEEIISIRDW